MERPRIFLDTKSTNSTTYVDLLRVQLSPDIKGVSYFILAIDPDPKALYRIMITRILNVIDLELTAIWQVSLPHLTSGVYEGFEPNDYIIVQHKSTDPTVIVKSGVALEFNEVV
ncbi:MAG: hypothetical protein QW290_09300 [Sulfolobales archaeon]